MAARLDQQGEPASTGRRVRPYLALAAAAGLLLALGLTLLRPADGTIAARRRALAELTRLQQQQQRTVRSLQLLVDQQRSAWDPKLRAVFKRNARLVDRAIEECRQALHGRPGDRELRVSLAEAYQRKVEFLRLFSGLEEE